MDVPNERSSHERPVLRGLGLAVLVALIGGGGLATLVIWFAGPAAADWKYLLLIGLGSFAAGLLGLSEDLRGLSVPVRSAVLLLIAFSASVALIWMTRGETGGAVTASELAGASGAASFGWAAPSLVANLPFWVLALLVVYGVLFISSYINVANFMDGLNGISGFHGVVAGLAFAAAGALSHFDWLVIAGLALAAGFGGFLPWNLSKPGGFLGDVGSYLLGGSVAITSFAALVAGVPVLATIGPMIVYFGDVGVTLVKRVRAGHKWDEPHKEHVYQQLQQQGRSHVSASLINAAFTAAASLLGLASFFVAPVWWWGLLVAGLALLAVYLRLPRLLAR
ncbi:MAG: UDP-phosphate alpha-N-acetyl-D-fucosaminephosphotransferase [Leucobacter sp.]|nr:UDP-phosphate alpha-N-acetyl-D-fucosaminephosphotransferase [Leucobacter sp.]